LSCFNGRISLSPHVARADPVHFDGVISGYAGREYIIQTNGGYFYPVNGGQGGLREMKTPLTISPQQIISEILGGCHPLAWTCQKCGHFNENPQSDNQVCGGRVVYHEPELQTILGFDGDCDVARPSNLPEINAEDRPQPPAEAPERGTTVDSDALTAEQQSELEQWGPNSERYNCYVQMLQLDHPDRVAFEMAQSIRSDQRARPRHRPTEPPARRAQPPAQAPLPGALTSHGQKEYYKAMRSLGMTVADALKAALEHP